MKLLIKDKDLIRKNHHKDTENTKLGSVDFAPPMFTKV